MKTTAIIAEFNPFHNGHLAALNAARALTGADYLLVLMSGNYVQRGEPAAIDRYVRAEMALACGADLILASPSRCSIRSAEGYAELTVRLLSGLGAVDSLFFASEVGDLAPLAACAAALLDEDEGFRERLREGLKRGLSFPRARALALPEHGKLLEGPNNILGIEYLKALERYGSPIRPATFPRVGPGHASSSLCGDQASASAIRSAMQGGQEGWRAAIPPKALPVLDSWLKDYPPLFSDDFSLPLGLALIGAQAPLELSAFENVTKALSRTFWQARRSFVSFSQFAQLAKSRSVTMTAVSRALLSIALGLRRPPAPDESGTFVQVLGYRERARPLISRIAASSRIPLVIRPSREAFPAAFGEELRLLDTWGLVLAQKAKKRPAGPLSRRLVIL